MLRRPLHRLLRPALLLLALLWLPATLVTAIDLDVTWRIPALVAFLPYLAALTLVVLLAAALLRARVVAVVALAGLLVLLLPRAGRVAADDQPAAAGATLVVMTANVHYGTADAAALARIVRDGDADLLALQEDTPEFHAALAAEGLRRQLPHGALRPGPRARGISLYSRHPITPIPGRRGDRRSVGGALTTPDGTAIHVRSVHPPPPFNAANLPGWKTTTRALLTTAATTTAPTILAGDFNATLDHHPLRHLLDAGYRDAADETGDAWRPTWSRKRIQRLTLDHILIPNGIAAKRTSIRNLPGSDHDVVVSTLQLPR